MAMKPTEQTLNIIQDRKAKVVNGVKMTYRALGEKYGISYQRVKEICDIAKIKVDMRKYRNIDPLDITK